MAWKPRNNIIDPTQFIKNIFDFFKEHQVEALEWAKGDDMVALEPIRKLYPRSNSITNTVFPALIALKKDLAEDLGDYLSAEFSITLQFFHQGGNPDKISNEAIYYNMALRSMLANLDNQTWEITFSKNSKIQMNSVIQSLETDFDELLGSGNSAYLQSFTIKARYMLIASPQ